MKRKPVPVVGWVGIIGVGEGVIPDTPINLVLIADLVSDPTIPYPERPGWERLLLSWNLWTALWVRVPKYPETMPSG